MVLSKVNMRLLPRARQNLYKTWLSSIFLEFNVISPFELCENDQFFCCRFVVACGDGEYIIYTAMALRNKSFGNAQEFIWASDSSE